MFQNLKGKKSLNIVNEFAIIVIIIGSSSTIKAFNYRSKLYRLQRIPSHMRVIRRGRTDPVVARVVRKGVLVEGQADVLLP